MLAVIPALNESASLPELVAELRRAAPDVEILVVDDGSTDGTAELLPRLGVHWLRFPFRQGIGTALRAGLRYARQLGHDTVVRLDADGQHDPADIAALAERLRLRRLDAVVGSRHLGGGGWRASWRRSALQRLVGFALRAITRRPVSDPTSGFWLFGPRAVKLLGEHHPTGYAEPELHLVLWRNRLSVEEVSVTMRPRAAGESTLTFGRTLLALGRMLLALVVAPLRTRA